MVNMTKVRLFVTKVHTEQLMVCANSFKVLIKFNFLFARR